MTYRQPAAHINRPTENRLPPVQNKWEPPRKLVMKTTELNQQNGATRQQMPSVEVVKHHTNVKPAEYFSDSKSGESDGDFWTDGGLVPPRHDEDLPELVANGAQDKFDNVVDDSPPNSTPQTISTPKTISSSDLSYAVSQLEINEGFANANITNSDEDDALPDLKDVRIPIIYFAFKKDHFSVPRHF